MEQIINDIEEQPHEPELGSEIEPLEIAANAEKAVTNADSDYDSNCSDMEEGFLFWW
jgi:hypothetical protein